jgi:hypothetical protein
MISTEANTPLLYSLIFIEVYKVFYYIVVAIAVFFGAAAYAIVYSAIAIYLVMAFFVSKLKRK